MSSGNYQKIVGVRVDTGKKWKDPANGGLSFPIYSKIIDVGALPNNTTKTVALGNGPGGDAEVVDLAKYARVVGFHATNGSQNLINHRDLTIDLTTSSIRLITATDLSSYTQGYVEIEFCDTTDEGS